MSYKVIPFTELIGKTFTNVYEKSMDELYFIGEKSYKFIHFKECCESVFIDDICGDLHDLENSIILQAELTQNNNSRGYESGTWSFYRFATNKGSVVVKWFGTSSGYYSEEVDFIEIKN